MDQNVVQNTEETVQINNQLMQQQLRQIANIFAQRDAVKKQERAKKIAAWKAARGIKD